MMPLSSRQRPKPSSLEDARVEYVIHRAAVAAVLADPEGARKLLELSDEELGRLFKNRIWQTMGTATILNLDLQAMRDEEERLRKRVSRISKPRTPREDERSLLVRKGKLLRAEDYCRATGVSEKKLNRYLASARIFTIELKGESYIPAFFLSPMIHRDAFAKVIRRLGESTSGLEKWRFLTTPIGDLGGSTPLQFLAMEDVTAVMKAARDFAKRNALQLPKP
ncbi:hypothetical protein [Paraburkholderia sp. RL17-373-BIF-A]|uniref:hypothetical protein n=1 Tax=Paraburkholderia sp. RL17-373-BIF-A TaxID=3031629 RepID=UPI0038B98BAD